VCAGSISAPLGQPHATGLCPSRTVSTRSSSRMAPGHHHPRHCARTPPPRSDSRREAARCEAGGAHALAPRCSTHAALSRRTRARPPSQFEAQSEAQACWARLSAARASSATTAALGKRLGQLWAARACVHARHSMFLWLSRVTPSGRHLARRGAGPRSTRRAAGAGGRVRRARRIRAAGRTACGRTSGSTSSAAWAASRPRCCTRGRSAPGR